MVQSISSSPMNTIGFKYRLTAGLLAAALVGSAWAQTDLSAATPSSANPATNAGPPRNATVSISVKDPPPGQPAPATAAAVDPANPTATQDNRRAGAPAINSQMVIPPQNAPASAGGTFELNTRATAAQIRSASFEGRAPVGANVETRLDAATQAVANLRSRIAGLRGDAKARFEAALENTRQRAAQVRTSIRTLRTAAPEEFETARNQLAIDFEAYAVAFGEVEAAGAAGDPAAK